MTLFECLGKFRVFMVSQLCHLCILWLLYIAFVLCEDYNIFLKTHPAKCFQRNTVCTAAVQKLHSLIIYKFRHIWHGCGCAQDINLVQHVCDLYVFCLPCLHIGTGCIKLCI